MLGGNEYSLESKQSIEDMLLKGRKGAEVMKGPGFAAIGDKSIVELETTMTMMIIEKKRRDL